MTSPSLPQAMSAERIEKAAMAAFEAPGGIGELLMAPVSWDDLPAPHIRAAILVGIEVALRAAYPELADGSSVILPREATPAMRKVLYDFAANYSPGSQTAQPVYAAMRDAALSAPEST